MMIKKALTIFLICCISFYSCKESSKHTILDDIIPLKQLKEDVTYFRLILEAVHPGLYLYASEKEMNHRLDSVANSLSGDMTMMDFFNQLAPVINSIHCGHTSIYPPTNFEDSIHRISGYFPVPVNVVNNKLVVNSTEFEIPLGAEIVTINREKVSKFLPDFWNYEPVDGYNSQYQQEEGGWDFSTNYFKNKGPKSSFKIGYKNFLSDVVTELEITAVT